jgi:uncharacterized protein YbjT (DUF2867 family)
MESRTAIVFGATGLVGSALTEELLREELYVAIKIFVRNKTEYSSEQKIEEHIIDFSKLDEYSGIIKGEDLFICLGTTIKKAGSVAKMEETDRDIPLKIAAIASANEVKRICVISSIGANAASSNYYLRIKGEMEAGILNSKIDSVAIIRPSILLGARKEKRMGEAIGKIFIKIFGFLLSGKFLKYRGIEARNVAVAMVRIMNNLTGKEIIESDKLQRIAGRK